MVMNLVWVRVRGLVLFRESGLILGLGVRFLG